MKGLIEPVSERKNRGTDSIFVFFLRWLAVYIIFLSAMAGQLKIIYFQVDLEVNPAFSKKDQDQITNCFSANGASCIGKPCVKICCCLMQIVKHYLDIMKWIL